MNVRTAFDTWGENRPASAVITLKTVVDSVFPAWIPKFARTFLAMAILKKLAEVGMPVVKQLFNKVRQASTDSVYIESSYVLPALELLSKDLKASKRSYYAHYVDLALPDFVSVDAGVSDIETIKYKTFNAFFKNKGLRLVAADEDEEDEDVDIDKVLDKPSGRIRPLEIVDDEDDEDEDATDEDLDDIDDEDFDEEDEDDEDDEDEDATDEELRAIEKAQGRNRVVPVKQEPGSGRVKDTKPPVSVKRVERKKPQSVLHSPGRRIVTMQPKKSRKTKDLVINESFAPVRRRWEATWNSIMAFSAVRNMFGLLVKTMKVRVSSAPAFESVTFDPRKLPSSPADSKGGFYAVTYSWLVTGFRGDHTAKDAVSYLIEHQDSEQARLEEAMKNNVKDVEAIDEDGDGSSSILKPLVKKTSDITKFRLVNKAHGIYERFIKGYTGKNYKVFPALIKLVPDKSGTRLKINLTILLSLKASAVLANLRTPSGSQLQVAPSDSSAVIKSLTNVAKVWLKHGAIHHSALDEEIVDETRSVLYACKSDWGSSARITPSPDGFVVMIDVSRANPRWSKFFDMDPGKKARMKILESMLETVYGIEDRLFAKKEEVEKAQRAQKQEDARKRVFKRQNVSTFGLALQYLVEMRSVGIADVLEKEGVTRAQLTEWMKFYENSRKQGLRLSLKVDPHIKAKILELAEKEMDAEERAYMNAPVEDEDDVGDESEQALHDLESELESLTNQLDKLYKSLAAADKDPLYTTPEGLQNMKFEIARLEKVIQALSGPVRKTLVEERGIEVALKRVSEMKLTVDPPKIKRGKLLDLIRSIKHDIHKVAVHYSQSKQIGRVKDDAKNFVERAYNIKVGLVRSYSGDDIYPAILTISLEAK